MSPFGRICRRKGKGYERINSSYQALCLCYLILGKAVLSTRSLLGLFSSAISVGDLVLQKEYLSYRRRAGTTPTWWSGVVCLRPPGGKAGQLSWAPYAPARFMPKAISVQGDGNAKQENCTKTGQTHPEWASQERVEGVPAPPVRSVLKDCGGGLCPPGHASILCPMYLKVLRQGHRRHCVRELACLLSC